MSATATPAQHLGGWDVVLAVRLALCRDALLAGLPSQLLLHYEAQLSPHDAAPYRLAGQLTGVDLHTSDSPLHLTLTLHLADVHFGPAGQAPVYHQPRVALTYRLGLRWEEQAAQYYLVPDLATARLLATLPPPPPEESYGWQLLWQRYLTAGGPWGGGPTAGWLLLLPPAAYAPPGRLDWLCPTAEPRYCLTGPAGTPASEATLNVLLLTEGRQAEAPRYRLPNLLPAGANAAYCFRDGLLLRHLVLPTLPTVLSESQPLLDFAWHDDGRTAISTQAQALLPLEVPGPEGLRPLAELPYVGAGDIELRARGGRLEVRYRNIQFRWNDTTEALYSVQLSYGLHAEGTRLRLVCPSRPTSQLRFFARPLRAGGTTIDHALAQLGPALAPLALEAYLLDQLARELPEPGQTRPVLPGPPAEAFSVATGYALDFRTGQHLPATHHPITALRPDQLAPYVGQYPLSVLPSPAPVPAPTPWWAELLLPTGTLRLDALRLMLWAQPLLTLLRAASGQVVAPGKLPGPDYLDAAPSPDPDLWNWLAVLPLPEWPQATQQPMQVSGGGLVDGCFQMGLQLTLASRVLPSPPTPAPKPKPTPPPQPGPQPGPKPDPVSIDALRLPGDYVSSPLSRVEGPLKVLGRATYAADYAVPDLLHGCVVSSPIARGKITRIYADEVLALPGVLQVFSHENVPALVGSGRSYHDDQAPGGSPSRPLHTPDILFSQQPVALVVADTLELARYAASVLRIDYEVAEHQTDLAASRDAAYDAPRGQPGFRPPPQPKGDLEYTCQTAPHTVDSEYMHHAQHHNPLELFATTVEWLGDGRRMTIFDKTQDVLNVQQYLRRVFGLSPDEARVVSKFGGGGFGAGLRPQYPVFLAVLAALALQRSVRVVLTRSQLSGLGYRPGTIQRVRLAADGQGQLQALAHKALAATSQFEDEAETVVNWSGVPYEVPTYQFDYQLAKIDTNTPAAMRAPGAASGNFALESALDELACATGLDPLELRLRNYSHQDPIENQPFSSKRLDACYREGADRFGWNRRAPEPRAMRDGHRLVGWGMAGGCLATSWQAATARASLSAVGHLSISSAATDQDADAYVLLTQLAAHALGLPPELVSCQLGDTALASSSGPANASTTTSVGVAVLGVCQELGRQLLRLAQQLAGSPLAGLAFEDVAFQDQRMHAREDAGRSVALRDVLAASGRETLEVTGCVKPDARQQQRTARYVHNAVFVEVQVDEELGTIQVTRVVNAVAAGRLLNPKVARSQVLGGTVWGLGMALMEASHLDQELGRFLNHSLADYYLPVSADFRSIDVLFVEEPDEAVNPLGAKDTSEIGLLGVAAAVANAVYHATGQRIRSLPLTLDKLL
jgi:xanthine dehydrogenase YagR molybdenum-binding subunit